MQIALVVMVGVVLLVAVVNNRRQPSRWDSRLPKRKGRMPIDGSAWAAFGGGSGVDCGGEAGGGCDGGGGGGD